MLSYQNCIFIYFFILNLSLILHLPLKKTVVNMIHLNNILAQTLYTISTSTIYSAFHHEKCWCSCAFVNTCHHKLSKQLTANNVIIYNKTVFLRFPRQVSLDGYWRSFCLFYSKWVSVCWKLFQPTIVLWNKMLQ